MYVKYDLEKVAADNLNLRQCYAALAMLMEQEDVGVYRKDGRRLEVECHSTERDVFDVWHLMNSHLTVDNRQVLMHISGKSGSGMWQDRFLKAIRNILWKWRLILWGRMICPISL